MAPPYLLITLPGPGDAFLAEAGRQGLLPAALAVAKTGDFADVSIPRLSVPSCYDQKELSSRDIAMILVVGWDRCIPGRAYCNLPLGAWNVHPSLLPRYRGHNPYFHVLANREKKTGITVHRLVDELDAGPILLQRELEIAVDETLGSLWQRLNRLGAEVALEAIRLIGSRAARTIDQPDGEYAKAPRVQSSDLLLQATMTVEEALALIRAANPFYGAALRLDGDVVKVFEARRCDPVFAADSERLIVPFSDGAIEVTVLEMEGHGYLTGRAWRGLQRG